MSVNNKDIFKHWGNKHKYELIAIALPFSVAVKSLDVETHGYAFHTENMKGINYYSDHGIYYTKCDEYMVLYKRDNETSTTVYARPLDMFFEHVDGEIRRFTKQMKETKYVDAK
ncbi:DUF1653 domain-containing protein [Priestia megaterium]|uniref:DUF1653 domain-containing protein n=1 Tax=Priestia megaterium TaxID=1404 RepID=UPI002E21FD35|nr:DUF1653 domain-containing protein [Priestia megaterium]